MERTHYPQGAPCWVDTLQPDPQAAARFYGQLFGWELDEPRPMPDGLAGQYYAARIAERLVSGIGQAPPMTSAAVWSTYIRVDGIEESVSRATAAGGRLAIGPLDAGPDGRLAVLTDASGVAFSLWEGEERAGAQLVDEPGAWAMSALHTASPDRAAAFYGSVFGWRLESVPQAPLKLWRLPGHTSGEPHGAMPTDVVAVMAPIEDASEVPPHWAVNFRVDDVDATAERAVALGGTLVMPPTDTPGFRSAAIADPQRGVVAVSAATAA